MSRAWRLTALRAARRLPATSTCQPAGGSEKMRAQAPPPMQKTARTRVRADPGASQEIRVTRTAARRTWAARFRREAMANASTSMALTRRARRTHWRRPHPQRVIRTRWRRTLSTPHSPKKKTRSSTAARNSPARPVRMWSRLRSTAATGATSCSSALPTSETSSSTRRFAERPRPRSARRTPPRRPRPPPPRAPSSSAAS